MATKKNQRSISFSTKEDIELFEKIDKYNRLTHTKKTDLVRDYFKDILKNTILDNKTIPLKKPFYFNKQDLINNESIKATIKNPKHNRDNFIKIKEIPNNLDKFNQSLKTYCFIESDINITKLTEKEKNILKNIHKGIDLYIIPPKEFLNNNESELNNKELIICFLMFEYDLNKNTLDLDLIKLSDIKEIINLKDYNELFEGFEKEIQNIKNDLNKLDLRSIYLKYVNKSYFEDLGLKNNIKTVYATIQELSLNYAYLTIDYYNIFKNNNSFFEKFIKYYESEKNKNESQRIKEVKQDLININESLFYELEKITKDLIKIESLIKGYYLIINNILENKTEFFIKEDAIYIKESDIKYYDVRKKLISYFSEDKTPYKDVNFYLDFIMLTDNYNLNKLFEYSKKLIEYTEKNY